MSRTLHIAVAALASALVIAAVAPAATAPKTVRGAVGPGFTINLMMHGSFASSDAIEPVRSPPADRLARMLP
jgi:hypothetical protein